MRLGVFRKIAQNSFSKYENGFIWLKNAGSAIPVYNVKEAQFPLLLNKQRNLMKLFQNDVGLLTSQYADGSALSILSGNVNINYGAIYENFVAQELLSHGFGQLYYFNSKKCPVRQTVEEVLLHFRPLAFARL